MQVPTVRVVSEAAPGGFMLINASDYVDGVHELCAGEVAPSRMATPSADGGEAELAARLLGKFMSNKLGLAFEDWIATPEAERIERMRQAETEFDEAVVPVSGEPPAQRVAKGPRGRWYGWRGKERVTEGFDSAEAAENALTALAKVESRQNLRVVVNELEAGLAATARENLEKSLGVRVINVDTGLTA